MSARDLVEKDLRAALRPKRWKLIPTQSNPDFPDRTTVMLKLLSFESSKAGPKAAYEYTFVATIYEPEQDIEKAERALDDHSEDLFQIIESVSHLNPTKAEKVTVKDQMLGYDITFTALYAKEA